LSLSPWEQIFSYPFSLKHEAAPVMLLYCEF
jgi:hypothetical protein